MIRIIVYCLVGGCCATLIPTSIIHGILAHGTDCSLSQACCVVGVALLYTRRMITVLPTMFGGI